MSDADLQKALFELDAEFSMPPELARVRLGVFTHDNCFVSELLFQ